jgi:hypothetical protein
MCKHELCGDGQIICFIFKELAWFPDQVAELIINPYLHTGDENKVG